ncbi:hypothetical protein MMC25_006856 [Agyrium rufum]|nr:hypothetical protein [Agyrium rufum]
MALSNAQYAQKRKSEAPVTKPAKRSKKAIKRSLNEYHSSDSDAQVDEFDIQSSAEERDDDQNDDGGFDLAASSSASDTEPTRTRKSIRAVKSRTGQDSESDASSLDSNDNDDDDLTATFSKTNTKPPSKRHDPTAFSTSLTSILNSKLPRTQRSDPVLSRSKTSAEAQSSVADAKLTLRAQRKLKEQRRKALERGRVKDVLLGEKSDGLDLGAGLGLDGNGGVEAITQLKANKVLDGNGVADTETAAEIAEQERRYRKTAQRGVVKLFNAVRAAQVRGEEARKERLMARTKGSGIGMGRAGGVNEMGKEEFLKLVGGGGKS